MSEEQLALVVERVRRIPDSYRAFTEPVDRAVRLYWVPQALLSRLVERGFPHRRPAGQAAFDATDLRNTNAWLRLPSPVQSAVALVAAAVTAGRTRPAARYTVDLVARCPGPAHPDPCPFSLAGVVPDTPEVTARDALAPGHVRVAVTLPAGGEHHFSGAYRDLLDTVRDVEFCRLPRALRADLSFLREARLADCQSGSRYLLAQARERGIAARPAFGAVLASPFSNTHSWMELLVGRRWLPADPLFLSALHQRGVLDPASWPRHRSPLGTHWRLGTAVRPLAWHGDTPAEVSLLTRDG